MIRIAVDAMSGDRGHAVAIDAALHSIQVLPDLAVTLVGQKSLLHKIISDLHGTLLNRISIQDATEVVMMDDSPIRALRQKQNSSMRVALDLLKQGEVQGAVSAGNTGALVVMASHLLPMIDAIERPALIGALPARNGQTLMLDLGANTNATPEQLLQFATMGHVLAHDVGGIKRPRVGLLNIGTEDAKGSAFIRAAGRLLSTTDLNYIGFVEGGDIFCGAVDVVVCEGFVGNVALKSAEGLGNLLGGYLKETFNQNWMSRLAGKLARPFIQQCQEKVDPRIYNGAALAGLQSVVVKSHGNADALAFSHAIEHAYYEVLNNIPARIQQELPRYFPTS